MADAGDSIDLIIVVIEGLTCNIPMLNAVVSSRSKMPGRIKTNREVLEKEIGLPFLIMN